MDNQKPYEMERLESWGYPEATVRSMMIDVFAFELWRINAQGGKQTETLAYLQRRIDELSEKGI